MSVRPRIGSLLVLERRWTNPAWWRAADRAGGRPRDRRSYVSALRRDPCAYCPSGGGTVDHIEATAGGGADDWPNWIGACQHCNSSKGTTPLLLWLLGRGEGGSA